MKKLLLAGTGFMILVLLSLAAQAQDYLPFADGKIYHFIARDSIYSLSISTHPSGVSYFNRMVKPGIVRTGNATCIGTASTYHDQANNQFGEKMAELPGGEYKFLVLSGATFPLQQEEFLLKTRIPIGHTWTMNGPANLVATLASRSTVNLGPVTDSALIFNLNQGGQIILTKNHGFLQATNFTAYVAGSGFPKRQLAMYKLPDPWNGNSLNSPLKIFDFQPNDRFSYYKWQHHSVYSCYEEWNQYKVLTRTNSANGTVIDYTLEHQKLVKTTPIGSPTPCTGNATYTVSPPVIIPLHVDQFYRPEISQLTNGFVLSSNQYRGLVSTHTKPVSSFNQREVLYFRELGHGMFGGLPPGVTCSNLFFYTPDQELDISYGIGLGKTREYSIDMWPNITSETLEAYVKGTETYGTFQSFAQIMGTSEATEPHPFSAFPNPFTNELSLKFNDTFTGENATVSVLNTLGQEIYMAQLSTSPSQEIKLNLPEMAKGIYVLRVTGNGKTHTTRLVKE